MTPNVATRVMARLGASLVAVLGLAAPAWAGDRALIDFIGYSTDGRYFAFEEFGVQDGSGFAYASIFVVDLEDDSWVAGSPFRVQAEDEALSVAEIRGQVRAAAEKELTARDISVPVQIAALIGDGVPDTDAQNLIFGTPSFGVGSVANVSELKLETFASTSPLPCTDWADNAPLGFALSLTLEDGTTRELHRDAALPRSRNCPQAYRLYGVVLPFGGSGPIEEGVAIVSVFPLGFEGPDRRFLAVPLAN